MPVHSQPGGVPCPQLAQLDQLASELHANTSQAAVWEALGQTLADFFGYSLFTVLAFSKQGGVARLHSTNTDLHPLGKRNNHYNADNDNGNVGNPCPPPRRPEWVQQVLVDGTIWRGSKREGLRAAFEGWEQLWKAGLGSVMNIPVRLNGVTIGSLNILDKEHGYDAADFKLGILIARTVAYFIHRVSQEMVRGSIADDMLLN